MWASWIIVLAVLVASPSAFAADPTQLLQQGYERLSSGDFEGGMQAFETALTQFQAQGNREGEWYALYFLGTSYASRGSFAQGIDYLARALEVAKVLHDPVKTWDASHELGSAYLNRGEAARALPLFASCQELEKSLNDPQRVEKTRAKMARAREAVGRSRGVPASPDQALGTSPELTDPVALMNDGQRLVERGDAKSLRLALERYRAARAAFQGAKDPAMESVAILAIASVQGQLAQQKAAIQTLEEGLALARTLRTPMLESSFLTGLARSYFDLGDLPAAFDYASRALPLSDPTTLGRVTLIDLIGQIHSRQGDYAAALRDFNEALEVHRKVGNLVGEAKTLGSVGSVYVQVGEYAEALEASFKAVELLHRAGERANEVSALDQLGRLHLFLGQSEKGFLYLNQALTLARELEDVERQAISLANLAVAHSNAGELEIAIEKELEALAQARAIESTELEATILGNLCLDRTDAGQPRLALDDCRKALTINEKAGSRVGTASSLANLSRAYFKLGDSAKALELGQRAAVLLHESGERRMEGFALTALGRIWIHTGETEEGMGALTRAVEIWETLRERLRDDDTNKVSILEEQASTYRLLQRALILRGQTGAALEIAERGRARAFAELLLRRRDADSKNAPNVASPTLAEMKQIARRSSSTLVEYSLLYDDMSLHAGPVRTEDRLLIWVVQPSGDVHFRSEKLEPSEPSLADLVAASRSSLGLVGRGVAPVDPDRVRGATNAPLAALHRKLIDPIQSLLPSDPNAHVVFVPQGPLFLVPFPALTDGDGHHLVTKHGILTAPSIHVVGLAQQRSRRAKSSGGALVMGNPTMPKVSVNPGEPARVLPALPGAERESLAVAPLLKTKALIGSQATKSVFLERGRTARIIHLATHGLLDDLRGIFSSIALAPTADDDGLLSAEEILRIDLDADLIVLSACDTGRGKITGDGVIGLSRSLLSAGASSVLVSLWSVPDGPTADLMTSFYQHLEKSPDRARALRLAMLDVAKSHPNPRDWAAFTLIGAAE